MKYAEGCDWSDMGFAPPNVTGEISLGLSMWSDKESAWPCHLWSKSRPHDVIRHLIEKVLNSLWLTPHLTWSSTRHREAKGVYTSWSLSSNSYGLVV